MNNDNCKSNGFCGRTIQGTLKMLLNLLWEQLLGWVCKYAHYYGLI